MSTFVLPRNEKNNPMSSNRHNLIIETINNAARIGQERNLLHLLSSGHKENGRYTIIEGKKLLEFGGYSYLNLSRHPKLIEAFCNTAREHGIQFPMSRALCSIEHYSILEGLLEKIFGCPNTVFPSTTAAHQAAIPTIIGNNDIVIIDENAHASIYSTILTLYHRGIKVIPIRHSNMNILEDYIKKYQGKAARIWYMCDSIYSMMGDYAPLADIQQLINKYKTLNLYIDDAHGMSITGKFGKGYALSNLELHDRMIMITSLNKTFTGTGGVVATSNKSYHELARNCAGTFIFSSPLNIPNLGLNIASAELHLNGEIERLQASLNGKINAARHNFKMRGLPEVSSNDSPIFFIATGLPKICFNLFERLKNDGIFTGICLFPAVSPKCTGLRICITNALEYKDIVYLTERLSHHLPLIFEDENYDPFLLNKAFKKNLIKKQVDFKLKANYSLGYYQYDTIQEINIEEWNGIFGSRGSFDWKGLEFLENTFCNHPEKENNWELKYIIIRAPEGSIIFASFFTITYCKDDLFSDKLTSMQAEESRKSDPYYLCSKAVIMGSPLTCGNHLYLNRKSELWCNALELALRQVSLIADKVGATTIVLRDFAETDLNLKNILINEGYFELQAANSHILSKQEWESDIEFVNGLDSKKSRHHVRRNHLEFKDEYKVNISNKANSSTVKKWFNLYKNVKERSFDINTFDLTYEIIFEMSNSERWDVIELISIKSSLTVGVLWCYKGINTYNPLIIGMDYSDGNSATIYKQMCYRLTEQARNIGVDTTYLGYGADLEKKRIGASSQSTLCFIQINDSYSLKILEMLAKSTGRLNEDSPLVH
jgi:7-keto-8-aminopelargonate synthetase-like enzyme